MQVADLSASPNFPQPPYLYSGAVIVALEHFGRTCADFNRNLCEWLIAVELFPVHAHHDLLSTTHSCHQLDLGAKFVHGEAADALFTQGQSPVLWTSMALHPLSSSVVGPKDQPHLGNRSQTHSRPIVLNHDSSGRRVFDGVHGDSALRSIRVIRILDELE